LFELKKSILIWVDVSEKFMYDVISKIYLIFIFNRLNYMILILFFMINDKCNVNLNGNKRNNVKIKLKLLFEIKKL